jgi:hypothetical protein
MPLELDIDGVRWRGKADRIEVDRGIVRVVDYKTGSGIPTTSDAAVSMQLGFYVLAVRSDQFIIDHGPANEAEMWFPAKLDSKSLTVRRFDTSRLDGVVESLKSAGRGIKAEQWQAIPNPHCRSCRVRIVCPEWPEGREAFSA